MTYAPKGFGGMSRFYSYAAASAADRNRCLAASEAKAVKARQVKAEECLREKEMSEDAQGKKQSEERQAKAERCLQKWELENPGREWNG